jgi:hypothetical protein
LNVNDEYLIVSPWLTIDPVKGLETEEHGEIFFKKLNEISKIR